MSTKQQLSELMDGELQNDEADRLLARLKDDPAAGEAWATYHAIGDALRDEWLETGALQQRVVLSLRDEPTVMAPRASTPGAVRWPRIALAAGVSAAAVALTAWYAFTSDSALSPTPVANVDAYLQAHQDFAPAPVGLRQVSYEPGQ